MYPRPNFDRTNRAPRQVRQDNASNDHGITYTYAEANELRYTGADIVSAIQRVAHLRGIQLDMASLPKTRNQAVKSYTLKNLNDQVDDYFQRTGLLQYRGPRN